ncbi:MAG: D-alanyl-D-alanine carboxypeptidase family protein [Oscillospiraceae bacterium]
MKKIVALCICMLFVNCNLFTCYGNSKPLEFMAKGIVVMQASSGRVLFEQNAYEKLPMASTTKIMTALLALEEKDIDEPFIVNEKAIQVEGTSMGLKVGDEVTLRTLAYGMLMPSGNDAAGAAAIKIAGSIPKFAQMMNEKAKVIGLKDTNFVTPSGLDAPEHYTTAYDLALLSSYALENPDFKAICKENSAKVSFGSPARRVTLKNHNKLLKQYDGAVGVKTGYTKKAGRCLVSAVEKDGMTLICVTLKAADDWNVHETLYDYFFDKATNIPIAPTVINRLVAVVGSDIEQVSIFPARETVTVFGEEGNRIKFKFHIPTFLYAPISKGDHVGKIEVYVKEVRIDSIPLLAQETIDYKSKKRIGIFDWFSNKD